MSFWKSNTVIPPTNFHTSWFFTFLPRYGKQTLTQVLYIQMAFLTYPFAWTLKALFKAFSLTVAGAVGGPFFSSVQLSREPAGFFSTENVSFFLLLYLLLFWILSTTSRSSVAANCKGRKSPGFESGLALAFFFYYFSNFQVSFLPYYSQTFVDTTRKENQTKSISVRNWLN